MQTGLVMPDAVRTLILHTTQRSRATDFVRKLYSSVTDKLKICILHIDTRKEPLMTVLRTRASLPSSDTSLQRAAVYTAVQLLTRVLKLWVLGFCTYLSV